MRKKAIVMTAFLIILVGCGTKDTRNIIEYQFREGTKGLEMQLLQNSPPPKVYENSDILISAEISNLGAYDIENSYLALGIEDEYMEVRDWNGYIIKEKGTGSKRNTFGIQGKSQLMPEGQKSAITIRAKTRTLEQQTETHTSVVALTACYKYKTILEQEVCIDPDVYNLRNEKKVCTVTPISLSSQGAPVAVVKIEPLMLDSEDSQQARPQFMIYIRNVGNGEVYSQSIMEDACGSSAISKDNINMVSIKANVAGRGLQCTPQQVHLKDKEGIVKCSMEQGVSKAGNAFSSPLVVEIDYGYSFTVSRSVEIRRLGRQ
ncbi:MAG: hypothetical protein ABIF10_02190 [Candidatus Woesearchaeota archaeon]